MVHLFNAVTASRPDGDQETRLGDLAICRVGSVIWEKEGWLKRSGSKNGDMCLGDIRIVNLLVPDLVLHYPHGALCSKYIVHCIPSPGSIRL